MARVIDDSIMACDYCTDLVANGKSFDCGLVFGSAFDISDKQEKASRAGIARFEGRLFVDDSAEFSWRPCEVCGSRLGGGRYRLIELGD
jgi:hypothetical protein